MSDNSCEVCGWSQTSDKWAVKKSSVYEFQVEIQDISTAAPHCPFCKLILNALLEYDRWVQAAASTSSSTCFPLGKLVSITTKGGQASYAKGRWGDASRVEMYTDMSKGQIILPDLQ